MGNPQETVSPFEMGWFAGFIDGEGAIGITTRNRKRKNGNKFITLKPHLYVTNTEHELIERCMYILDKLEVPYHISYYPCEAGNRKPHWALQIAGQMRVMKILPIIKDFLQSVKKEKAQIVMDFCKSRENFKKGDGYTDDEFEMVNTLYQMNHRGIKGQAPQRLHARHFKSDDIVQTTTE